METLGWVLLALVVVAVVVLALYASKGRRRAGLRERFGPEYDRTVERVGDRREAETELAELVDRRDALDIRDLDATEAAGYRTEWEVVQARFVDEPSAAVNDADALLTTVMRQRGYPVDDFDERAALIATDHPEVVDHYRAAHSLPGDAGTEDLRQAFVHYRSLFEVLVGPLDGAEEQDRTSATATAAPEDTNDPDQVDLTGSDVRPRAAQGQEGPR